MSQCKAITKSGTRCKVMCKDGECRVHGSQQEAPVAVVEMGSFAPSEVIITPVVSRESRIQPERLRLYDKYFNLCMEQMLFTKKLEGLDAKLGEEKILFFKEDIYVPDLRVFYDEYKSLLATGQSDFFFKANLANFALILACFQRGCMKPFFQIYSMNMPFRYSSLKVPKSLITKLYVAYQTCKYDDILAFYIEYLEFYSFGISIYKENLDLLSVNSAFKRPENQPSSELLHLRSDLLWHETDKILQLHSKITRNVLAEMAHEMLSKKFVCFFSCNLVSESVTTRFIPTHIKVTHTGFKLVDNTILDSLEVIIHDYYMHNIFENNCSEEDNQFLMDMFIKIQHEPFAEVVFQGLWYSYNENKQACVKKIFFEFPFRVREKFDNGFVLPPLIYMIHLDGTVADSVVEAYMQGIADIGSRGQRNPQPPKPNPIPALREFASWLLKNFQDFPYKKNYIMFLKKTA